MLTLEDLFLNEIIDTRILNLLACMFHIHFHFVVQKVEGMIKMLENNFKNFKLQKRHRFGKGKRDQGYRFCFFE